MSDPGDLVTASTLSTWPGAPFTDNLVAAACGAVRTRCGWHIAPVAADDLVTVSGSGTKRLVLPTLRYSAITAVRDVVTGTVFTDWRPGLAGTLIRDAGWPRGEDNLEVTLTHGFATCPPDLMAVVVERVRALATPAPAGTRQFARTVGGVSTSTAYVEAPPAWSLAAAAVLDRYTV